MKYFIKQIYTLWCAIVFIGIFLILYPFFLLIIIVPAWHKHAIILYKIWATVSLFLVGIRTEFIKKDDLNSKMQYVYCSNHFSLLDIVCFGFAPNPVVFVGKRSLAKIPLFGFMFRKLNVTVDRNSIKDRYNSLQTALQKMEDGRSLVMYPEGGILSKNIPEMARFKDGAFRAAITKQIPIVPVTLPDNWIILPDEKIPLISRRKMRMIFHKPIPTKGLTMEDVDSLKDDVFQVIAKELKKYH